MPLLLSFSLDYSFYPYMRNDIEKANVVHEKSKESPPKLSLGQLFDLHRGYFT